jgi:hypothetical protein
MVRVEIGQWGTAGIIASILLLVYVLIINSHVN